MKTHVAALNEIFSFDGLRTKIHVDKNYSGPTGGHDCFPPYRFPRPR
jgi:hypothetical protein